MAKLTGKNGIIKVTDEAISQLRSWSLDKTGDTVEDTVIGDDWRTFKATMKGASGSCELYYDEDDLAIAGLGIGDEVEMEIYLDGEAEGANFQAFTAIITTMGESSSFDGMVEQTMGFTVTGAVIKDIVPTP